MKLANFTVLPSADPFGRTGVRLCRKCFVTSVQSDVGYARTFLTAPLSVGLYPFSGTGIPSVGSALSPTR